jgi:hypothetical protein
VKAPVSPLLNTHIVAQDRQSLDRRVLGGKQKGAKEEEKMKTTAVHHFDYRKKPLAK